MDRNLVPSLLPVVSFRSQPQGSALGALLFMVFVNDIPSTVSSPTFMDADDTNIFHFVTEEQ